MREKPDTLVGEDYDFLSDLDDESTTKSEHVKIPREIFEKALKSDDMEEICEALRVLANTTDAIEYKLDVYVNAPSERRPFMTDTWYRKARNALRWYDGMFRSLDRYRHLTQLENKKKQRTEKSEEFKKKSKEKFRQFQWSTLAHALYEISFDRITLSTLKTSGAVPEKVLKAARAMATPYMEERRKAIRQKTASQIKLAVKRELADMSYEASANLDGENWPLSNATTALLEAAQERHRMTMETYRQVAIDKQRNKLAIIQANLKHDQSRTERFIKLLYNRELLPLELLDQLWSEVDAGFEGSAVLHTKETLKIAQEKLDALEAAATEPVDTSLNAG